MSDEQKNRIADIVRDLSFIRSFVSKVGTPLLHDCIARLAGAALALGLEVRRTGMAESPLGGTYPLMVFGKGSLEYHMDMHLVVDEVLYADRENKARGLNPLLLRQLDNMGRLRDHILAGRIEVLKAFAAAHDVEDFRRRMVAISSQFAAVRIGRVENGAFVVEEAHGQEVGASQIPAAGPTGGEPRHGQVH